MARYSTRQPFSTSAHGYKALRHVRLGGTSYAPGDTIPKDAATDRRFAALYDQRHIDMIVDAPEAAPAADSAPAPDAKKPAAKKAAAKKAPAKDAAKDADATPRYTVKQAGLGGFKVIAPDGSVVGNGHETHALAKAEAERLNAEQLGLEPGA